MFIAESVSEFFKSVNIWQSYEQQGDCLVHFVRLATTLLNDEESARNNHVLACTFAKYSLFFYIFSTDRLSDTHPKMWNAGESVFVDDPDVVASEA